MVTLYNEVSLTLFN